MIKKVAILANGGDVSGFNAVIRAIVKTAENNGVECYGFIDGYNGLLKNDYEKLSTANDEPASGILAKGGSIIGSSTNANVFNYKVVNENGEIEYKDLSDVCIENIKKDGFDCLFTLGGDGTLKSARDFSTKGVNVIGVPKTIDNDVACTEITFGYNTAVSVAAEALDRLHTTGETHHRIMVLEVMGRYAGWIALESAIAGGADIALIPEIPFDINKAVEKINSRIAKGKRLDLLEKNVYRFCFIVDFPMYELSDEGTIDFSHNPFSMPQGGLEALKNKNPLEILAYQYDLVCNGYEMASGAVRNHNPEIMVKAFEIAGYTEEDVKNRFGALYNAFQYGTPPHAGAAPGIDRMIMLIANSQNIREVIAFPKNKRARDLLMRAPSQVSEQQLKDVHIKLD